MSAGTPCEGTMSSSPLRQEEMSRPIPNRAVKVRKIGFIVLKYYVKFDLEVGAWHGVALYHLVLLVE